MSGRNYFCSYSIYDVTTPERVDSIIISILLGDGNELP